MFDPAGCLTDVNRNGGLDERCTFDENSSGVTATARRSLSTHPRGDAVAQPVSYVAGGCSGSRFTDEAVNNLVNAQEDTASRRSRATWQPGKCR